jgi:hypothetical protein
MEPQIASLPFLGSRLPGGRTHTAKQGRNRRGVTALRFGGAA